MAENYNNLRKLTKEQLITEYDKLAGSTSLGLAFYREELARREAEEQTAQIIEINNQMRNMTIAITIFTVINLALTLVILFK